MPTIIFTGGGSAGHVTPNLAIIEQLQKENWKIIYIGSINGIEKDLIKKTGIPYHAIFTGKLRRYFSWQNFLDLFKILGGIVQAFFICWRTKPNVVFSKGGFVAFPVVVGAWLNRIPVICHESDLTPGLANRLSFPFAKKVLLTFSETRKYFSYKNKLKLTGTPIRTFLLQGDAHKGRAFCHLTQEKPIILVIGGGLGAGPINKIIRQSLPQLLQTYQVIHLCGKNKTDNTFDQMNGYQQFDYITDEMGDLFVCADLVISRAGANTLYEILALKKLNILIPLSAKASRSDQIANARYFQQQGLSEVIFEEDLTPEKLLDTIQKVFEEKAIFEQRLAAFHLLDSVALIHQELIL